MDEAASREALFAERFAERSSFVERTIEREGVRDARVLAALRRVPRHRFVSAEMSGQAYADYPLPIGLGQTISQPFMVAYMTEHAKVTPQDRCLEVGTGSGYQAAILSELCAETYSIEYFPSLAKLASASLESLGYHVHQRVGDGGLGWPEAAPFNVIIATAAPLSIPPPLLEQLAIGGRLIIPVGSQHGPQILERWTRRKSGEDKSAYDCEQLTLVQFVPFLGDAGGRR
jgi:protein-L-isoaspartate(D-aspartate) O-methyltransferase